MFNLSLVQRIHAAFALLLLLLLGGGMVTYSQSQHIDNAVVRMTSDANVLADLARQNQIALLRAGKALADMGQSRDGQMLAQQAALVADSLGQLQQLQQQLASHAQAHGHQQVLSRGGEGLQLLASLQATGEQIQQLLAKVLVESGAVATARSEFLLKLAIARQAIQRIAGAAAAEDQYVADMLKNFDESISLVEFIITNILAASDTGKMADMLAKVRVNVAVTEDFATTLADEVPALLESPDVLDGMTLFYHAVRDSNGILSRHIANVQAREAITAAVAAASQQVAAGLKLMDDTAADALKDIGVAEGAVGEALGRSNLTQMVVLATALVAVLIMAWLLAQAIRVPLARLIRVLAQMAEGDFREGISSDGSSEFARLGRSVNSLAERMKAMLSELHQAAAQLNQVAVENSATSQRSRLALERQNAEIQGVAAAITEMESAVAEIARHTDASREQTTAVEADAQSGRQVMTLSMDTLRQLEQRISTSNAVIGQVDELSRQITRIVEVITSIADKTNLLALNAAIEAARAGDQGRGFAVVADEVRQLASQTATSTDEIQAMIGQLQRQSREAVSTMAASVSEMGSTRSQIEEANSAMGQIVERMVQVRDMANHISEAARQQQLAAEEITRNVNVVSEVSLQNYGEVEQIANSNRELTGMAHALDALTNRFRV